MDYCMPQWGFDTAPFSLHKTPFFINMWMMGIYIGNSSGEPLIGSNYTVNSVQAVGVTHALVDTTRRNCPHVIALTD